jgi:hypothetical protein
MKIAKCKMKSEICQNGLLSNRHSRESGNPEQNHWIPGQARNDERKNILLTVF